MSSPERPTQLEFRAVLYGHQATAFLGEATQITRKIVLPDEAVDSRPVRARLGVLLCSAWPDRSGVDTCLARMAHSSLE